MYDITADLSIFLLGGLSWFGRRATAAGANVTVWSWSTSTSTTLNGQTITFTGATASSTPRDRVDLQGPLLTIAPTAGLIGSVCASWLDPQSHATIYEQCMGGGACMLIGFLDDSATQSDYDVSDLIGCSYSTLPPITTMYPYQHASSTGCWESGFGCCWSNAPYDILLTTANHHAAMFACAAGNHGRLPALGFEWETGTLLATETPLFVAATSSTGANTIARSAIISASSTPTVLPYIPPPTQDANSSSLSGRSKAGIAVGSIIGGWVLLAFAAVLLWRYRKRRREQQRPHFSFSFVGLEKAGDRSNSESQDRKRQKPLPQLPRHPMLALDTKDTAGQVSGKPSVGKTEIEVSSSGTYELARSSPMSAELTGSPIALPPSPSGSESPVLPSDPTGSRPASSSEIVVSPNPPPLRLPSAVGSLPEEPGAAELPD